MKLSLFNSLTRKIEKIEPIKPDYVKMYVCGPTVYDHPHIGNARSAVLYDLLFRFLRKIYGSDKVTYVRNITDIDDKIIDRAVRDGVSIPNLTLETTKHFHDDMSYLNCLSPSFEPRATNHIDDMINIISILLEKNIAYTKDGHVYFDVSKYNDYTVLSGRDNTSTINSGRIRHSAGKEHDEDFVLWKPAKEEDLEGASFQSPFGFGRPGWHIECSAMSRAYLGEDFDIHGGGVDLIFPHHTNEIAQSRCAFPGSIYAKYWIHNGFLTVDGQKMSKSLGNFLTVYELRQRKINPDAVRLLLLSTHYRKPLDFSEKAIDDCLKIINYWHSSIRKAIDDISEIKEEEPSKTSNRSFGDEEFYLSLADDLNISVAIRIVNELAKITNSFPSGPDKIEKAKILYSYLEFLGLLSSFSESERGKDSKSGYDIFWIESMIEERKSAKIAKDWNKADGIRQDLLSKGISIKDNPDGSSSWEYQD